ncbi:hypothetical protein F8568_041750 [Actinomadura sp. LD22]|uniref:DUF4333 domain-containing protein n=1 Tax=Actinomadura physcomitrii TaxID=2650748 RepID=A0A6I4MTV5_9ACTN|nr:hypothetical protein [Actinomadura physcomitrii]MWA06761.1 hypothetical protein [Actinomadura physcomitrii]
MRRVLALLAAAALAATLSGCKVMQRISEESYRNAVTDGVVAELDKRGIPLKARPSCRTPKTGDTVRVSCTARTKAGQPVVVSGTARDADSAHPVEDYTVTVAGRRVLDQGCLGLGCT